MTTGLGKSKSCKNNISLVVTTPQTNLSQEIIINTQQGK